MAARCSSMAHAKRRGRALRFFRADAGPPPKEATPSQASRPREKGEAVREEALAAPREVEDGCKGWSEEGGRSEGGWGLTETGPEEEEEEGLLTSSHAATEAKENEDLATGVGSTSALFVTNSPSLGAASPEDSCSGPLGPGDAASELCGDVATSDSDKPSRAEEARAMLAAASISLAMLSTDSRCPAWREATFSSLKASRASSSDIRDTSTNLSASPCSWPWA